jgi:hypothetical protein
LSPNRRDNVHKYLRVILMVGLVVTLLACTAAVAGARITYTTSKPVTSNAPKKDRPFVTSGYITPKSTTSNRAKVKIILWMKYNTGWGVMDTYWTKLSARNSKSTKYSVTINIPMKGDHGVQAVQYRKGKKVSKSATRYFYVTP